MYKRMTLGFTFHTGARIRNSWKSPTFGFASTGVMRFAMAGSALSEKLKDPTFATTLLETFSDGVFVVDTDQHILYWNRAATGLTGFTQEEVPGIPVGRIRRSRGRNRENRFRGCSIPCGWCSTMAAPRIFSSTPCTRAGYALPVNATIDPIFENETLLGAVENFQGSQVHRDSLGKSAPAHPRN